MILFYMDANFSILKTIKSPNVQWRRKYYECGSFSIQLEPADYLKNAKYVYTPDRPELGVISQVNFIRNKRENYIQISGYFAESILNKAICDVSAQYTYTDVCLGLTNFASRNYTSCHCMPSIIFDVPSIRGTNTDFNALGSNVGDKVYKIAKLHQISPRVYLKDDALHFKLWQGKDASIDGNNKPVIFSDKFNQLSSFNLLMADTNYKNSVFAKFKGKLVGSETEDVWQKVITTSENDKRWVSIDATSIGTNYISVVGYCNEEMKNSYSIELDLDFNADNTDYMYLIDYDLGDIITVLLPELGIQEDARIIEINEVFKNNSHSVKIKFGNTNIKEV